MKLNAKTVYDNLRRGIHQLLGGTDRGRDPRPEPESEALQPVPPYWRRAVVKPEGEPLPRELLPRR